jgi:hypothetical protein
MDNLGTNTQTEPLEPIAEAQHSVAVEGMPVADDLSLHPPAENLGILTPHPASQEPPKILTPLQAQEPYKPLVVGDPSAGLPPNPHPLGAVNTLPQAPITNNQLVNYPQPTPQAAGEHLTVKTASGVLMTPAGAAAANGPHWYAKFWHVLQGLPTDITSMLTIFDRLGPKFRAATILILKDTMVVITDVGQDAAAVGEKNAAGVVTLSEATMSAIRTLVQDALNGEKDIVADFKTLGVTVENGELVLNEATASTLTTAATKVVGAPVAAPATEDVVEHQQ